MNSLNELTKNYLQYCSIRKGLDSKTLRAYKADLADFSHYVDINQRDFLDKKCIGEYVDSLHCTKAPRTVKRRIASLRTFYHYLEREELISENPLHKLDLTFKLPQQLPRYIPNHIIKLFYAELYAQERLAGTDYQLKCATRNIAVIELLFATGMRISELCNLTVADVNLNECEVRIHGKGNKERIVQLTEDSTIEALNKYASLFLYNEKNPSYFFLNKMNHRLSPSSVRSMINNLTENASLSLHITPHMFRHSFATSLVNQDVDIRCIQEILGHSSIKTTEIYTHVDMSKQKSILQMKNPRKLIG